MANLLALCEILEVAPNDLMGWSSAEGEVSSTDNAAGSEESDNAVAKTASEPDKKQSKLWLFIAAVLVVLALVAGIFIGKSLLNDEPAGPLDGRESIEITSFSHDFNPPANGGDLKMTFTPNITDDSLTYEVIRMENSANEIKVYPVKYSEGICVSYVQTILFDEVTFSLRVSDGEKYLTTQLFAVEKTSDHSWRYDELWNK